MPGPKPNPKPIAQQRPDGTVTYRVRYRYRGKQTSDVFPTLLRAKVFCRTIRDHGVEYAVKLLEDREHLAQLEATDTLDDVADRYLTWKAGRVRSSRTPQDARRDYESVIRPRFGKMPVGTIDQRDVQAWVDALAAGRIVSPRTGRAYSPKSIANLHSLLHGILAWAVDPARGLIATNPAASTDLPKRVKPAPKGILPNEWQAVRAALAQIDADALDLADFLIGTGWRWSEAAALTVGAVEDYGNALLVTMQQVERRGADNKRAVVPDGKAAASLRRVSVGQALAQIIRRRIEGKHPGDAVFTRAGDPWKHIDFYKRLRRAGEVSGVQKKVTPHVLRHTHVGLLVMSGAALPELQARIGHANISTTIGVYGSMVQDVQPAALEKFEQMISPQDTPPPLPPA